MLHSSQCRTRILLAFAGLALPAIFAPLSGCDRETPESKTIRTAADDVDRLTGGGAAAPRDKEATKTYTAVASTLKGTKGSAASAISAQSDLGLAEVEMAEFRARERSALDKINAIIPELSLYAERHAVAGAAESFDPSAQIAEMTKSRSEKQTQAAKLTEQRAGVEKQVNDLRDQARAKTTASAAKMEEYSRLIKPTPAMSATEAAPIVEQANRIRREADALRLEGAQIDARADEIAPQLSELQLLIDQLVNQSKALDAYEADLTARQGSNREAAAAAKKDAGDAAAKIDELVNQIDAIRTKEIEEAAGKATRKLNDALRSAKEAQKDSPGSAKVSIASANHALGMVRWERSRGAAAFARMLDRLVEAKPPFPKANDYKVAAERSRKEAEDALKEADQALKDAGAALAGVPVSGANASAIKERLQNLAKLLEEATTKGAIPAPAAEPEPAKPAETSQSEKPADQPAETVAAADPAIAVMIEGFIATVKAGNYAELAQFIHTPNDQAKKALDAMLALTPSSLKLDEACKAKFGTSISEAQKAASGGAAPGATGLLDLSAVKAADIKAADVKIVASEDGAKVSHPALGGSSTVKKIDGKWMIVEPSLAMMAMMAPMLQKMGPVIDATTAEVETGKYQTIAEVVQALNAKVMQLMQPPAKPPGGGGGG